MARDQERVDCLPGVWTELTNSDVTEITFQVVTGSVKIRCTTGSAPGADRVFATPINGRAARVVVDHA
jgi:carbon monoxide dehydrogenase subunit G